MQHIVYSLQSTNHSHGMAMRPSERSVTLKVIFPDGDFTDVFLTGSTDGSTENDKYRVL